MCFFSGGYGRHRCQWVNNVYLLGKDMVSGCFANEFFRQCLKLRVKKSSVELNRSVRDWPEPLMIILQDRAEPGFIVAAWRVLSQVAFLVQ